LLGAEGPALESAVAYARPLLAGSPLVYFTQLFSAAMRGVGHAHWPLLIGATSVGVNVVLDHLLMFGHWGLPGLGIEGAAYGTLASKLLSAIWLGYLLTSGKVDGLRLRLRGWHVTADTLRCLARVGTPATLDYTLLNVAYLATVILVGRAGPTGRRTSNERV
jgi:Na+-driven multidrug efflux pump